MFQLAGRIVTDAGHEADLMIDEDERCVLRSEGLVGTGLIGHGILLGVLRLVNVLDNSTKLPRRERSICLTEKLPTASTALTTDENDGSCR